MKKLWCHTKRKICAKRDALRAQSTTCHSHTAKGFHNSLQRHSSSALVKQANGSRFDRCGNFIEPLWTSHWLSIPRGSFSPNSATLFSASSSSRLRRNRSRRRSKTPGRCRRTDSSSCSNSLEQPAVRITCSPLREERMMIFSERLPFHSPGFGQTKE
jgi:hypothetical protein